MALAGSAAADLHGAGHDDHPAAAVPAGPVFHVQHRTGAGRDDGRGLHAPSARLRDLSHRAVTDDFDAAVAERGLDAGRADAGTHRAGGCRQGDRIVRALRDRRQFRGRPDRVLDPGRDQLRGRDQGCRADRRSGGPLYAGRDAGQADGDRRGPEHRCDRRQGGTPSPHRDLPGGGFLRRDGRRQQVRAGRRGGRHPDHVHQRDRWPGDRHAAARPVVRYGDRQLCAVDDRRRPGGADSGARDLDRRRPDRFSRRSRGHRRRRTTG